MSQADAVVDPFAALVETWASVRDYSVTIDAHEVSGSHVDDRTLHYEFRKPDRARLEVVSGSGAGSVLVWRGGSGVVAFRRGVPWLRLHFDARAGRVTSPRGNGMLTPNLDDLLTCWSQHRGALTERAGLESDGTLTDRIALTYDGFTCPADSSADKNVTRDVLTVNHTTHLVVRRERFEGSMLVERWKLRDLQLNAGLSDSRF